MEQLPEKLQFVISASIGYLVHSGFISPEAAQIGWWPRYDQTERLEALGLGAGCTLDEAQGAIVAFNLKRTPEELLWSCPHEAVHLCQLLKSDWDPQMGYSFWKGQRFDFLASDDPDYYDKQPWEKEAHQLEGPIREHAEQYLPWYRESNNRFRKLRGSA